MKLSQKKVSQFVWTLLFAFVFFTAYSGENNQAVSSETSVVQAAKGESGELLTSIAMRLKTAKKLADQFQAKYPFIRKVKQYRADGERRLERALSEFRAGRHVTDIYQGSDMAILKKEGVIGRYESPERQNIDPRFKDEEGYWTDLYWYPIIIAYNTDLVSATDAPKSWHDLLNPKWRGQITMPRDQIEWYRVMLDAMGKEAGTKFMKALAKQKIRISSGVSDGVTMLAAGEFKLAVTRAQHIEIFKYSKGAPVDWVKDLNPMAIQGTPVAIMQDAPNPNSAKLFIDFLLSKDGATIVAKSGRLPPRMDVEGLSPGFKLMKRENLVRSPEDDIFKNYKKYRTQFRDLFGGPK